MLPKLIALFKARPSPRQLKTCSCREGAGGFSRASSSDGLNFASQCSYPHGPTVYILPILVFPVYLMRLPFSGFPPMSSFSVLSEVQSTCQSV